MPNCGFFPRLLILHKFFYEQTPLWSPYTFARASEYPMHNFTTDSSNKYDTVMIRVVVAMFVKLLTVDGLLLRNGLLLRQIMALIRNYIRCCMWDVISHSFANFDGGSAKSSLKLGHGWVLTFQSFTWKWLGIHAIKSMLIYCLKWWLLLKAPTNGNFQTPVWARLNTHAIS